MNRPVERGPSGGRDAPPPAMESPTPPPAGKRPRSALNECVKVVVRCRPLSDRESAQGHTAVVQVLSERGTVQVNSPKGQDKLFTYDAAYDVLAPQESIYDEMVRPLVNSVLDGFNGCVFAYGQTGTGKTYTMEGGPGCDGIIPRTFSHVWQHIQSEASEDVTYLVSCSYIELYMEDVRDLLKKDGHKKKLTLRGQEYTGFYIPEMTSVVCRCASDMSKVMRAGNKNRTTGRTDMNEHSSRSHAIFLITIEMAHKGTETIRVGKLNLVDLAGSERQGKTGAIADRLKEASKINQALSSLGNVISALAENSPHVPYRDSKLTRILQDSLGGNSKTIMIANIGPASYNYDETITTLRYAHRAKAIKNKPIRNEDPKDAKLHEYKEEIARLRQLLMERKVVDRKKEKPKKMTRSKIITPQENNEIENNEALTTELENQNIETESYIEAERCKTEELEAKIKQLQDRMVSGGVGPSGEKDIINNLNESQILLEQRNLEISERKKREVEMQQKIDLEEETTAHVNNTFTTLQQEVDHKTSRLKKCLAKYSSIRDEMIEMREAHDRERRELEALQEDLITDLKRKLLLADNFVPEAGRALVYRVRFNEDTDEWEIPHDYRHDDNAQAIQRPMAYPGRRRPISESVRNRPEMRYRAENLLDLKMEILGSTTKVYKKPEVPAALREVLNSALAREADLEIKKPPTARRRPTTAHHKIQGVR